MANWWEQAPVAPQPAQGEWWRAAPVEQPQQPVTVASGSVLPISRDSEGNVHFDSDAGLVGVIKRAFTLPHDVMTGQVPVYGEDGHTSDALVHGSVDMAAFGPAPVAARSIAEGAKAILARPDNPLRGVSKAAVGYARRDFTDPAKSAEITQGLNRLGPEAMLADVSPEWMGVARGAASRPSQRDRVVNALLNRDAGKNTRINSALDENLGRPVVPSQVDSGIRASQKALGPEYEAALDGARAVDTKPIADRLDTLAIDKRGPAQETAKQVRDMLSLRGTDQLDPNPRTLLSARQAIDGMLAGETNSDVLGVLKEARRAVDDELAAKVPGIKDVDAKFAELARQRQGLERGAELLDSGRGVVLRPSELQQEVQAAAVGNLAGPSAVPFRMRQGARAEIDRIVGTNANDVSALNRLMKGEGDWNRQKLATLFGQEKADRILGVLDAEQRFQQTANRVSSGSDTAMAQRFGDFLDEASASPKVPTDTTITGAALRGAQKFGQVLSRSNSDAKANRFASELGQLAVAQGRDRDMIVASLLAEAQAKRARGLSSPALEAVARAMLPATMQRD